MKIHYKNIRIIDPVSLSEYQSDLFIADGKIVACGIKSNFDFTADLSFAADTWCACPGLIDLSADLSPIKSELNAAMAGGVSSVVYPANLANPFDEISKIEHFIHYSNQIGKTQIYPLGAITRKLEGQVLCEFAALKQVGCIALIQSLENFTDLLSVRRAMEYAVSSDIPLWINPRHRDLSKEGYAHLGVFSDSLGLAGIPVSAETIAISSLLILAKETGVRLHLPGISSAAGVELITNARKQGLNISADVGIHHLHLCDQAIGYFDSQARFEPPLRDKEDLIALRNAASSGLLAICSAHSPCSLDAKLLPFSEAKPGATSIELLLPLTLRWAKEIGISLPQAIANLTTLPTQILGWEPMQMKERTNANICIFDSHYTWQINRENLLSSGINTPFYGEEIQGKVMQLLIDGKIVYQHDLANL